MLPNPRIPYLELSHRLERIGWGKLTELGKVCGYPFYVWHNTPSNARTSILISAGIHGNEPSGVEAILNLLEKRPTWLECADLTILPCLNPWGYEHNRRVNYKGYDLNRQWNPTEGWKVKNLTEITFVLRILKKRRFNLTVCLHEDYDATGFYLYELSRRPNTFGKSIIQTVSRFIPIEKKQRIEGRLAQYGVVHRSVESMRQRKQWPEALYHFKHHTDHTITTETPTHFPIQKRVRAQLETVRAILKL